MLYPHIPPGIWPNIRGGRVYVNAQGPSWENTLVYIDKHTLLAPSFPKLDEIHRYQRWLILNSVRQPSLLEIRSNRFHLLHPPWCQSNSSNKKPNPSDKLYHSYEPFAKSCALHRAPGRVPGWLTLRGWSWPACLPADPDRILGLPLPIATASSKQQHQQQYSQGPL